MATKDAKHDLVEAACTFWFHDNDRVRSPFPARIHRELKRCARKAFLEWLTQLEATDRSDLTDDELASQFELVLFREAQALVGEDDTDLLLTLLHPFMPRVGDTVDDATRGPSRVTDRKLEQRDDDKLYMILSMVADTTDASWQTDFLIPT